MTKRHLRLVLAATLLPFAACGDSDDNGATSNPDAAAEVTETDFTLRYDFDALPELGPDSVYEGWLIVDGAPVSTGTFSVDETGATTPAEFAIAPTDAEAATTFVLTIEPAVGDVPAPADTHILAGDITGGAADLLISHEAALATDFAAAGGSYILGTPTTGDDTLSEQGIWWLSMDTTPPSSSLDLPVLPAGWAYEGWIVDGSGPISTGRFVDPAGADSDMAGSAKGPVGDGPPFPGQDYITPAKVLNDGATIAVISVEPDPDDSPAPFLIKPLVHDPIGSALAPTSHTMANNAAATTPSGSVTLTAP